MRRERLSIEKNLTEEDEGRKENEIFEDSTSNFNDEFDAMTEEQIFFEIRGNIF